MTDLNLIIPMAGRGSRFSRAGILEPKPLVDLLGRPFFWWAVESVKRTVGLRRLSFVVLAEHCASFGIDRTIRSFYPEATITVIEEVTSGAAETAKVALADGGFEGPIAFNDCDHAFVAPGLATVGDTLATGAADAALMCFRSQSPAFSYAMLDGEGAVRGTVEKQVVSPFAIAGCYLFKDVPTFLDAYAVYARTCRYDELFMSGIVDLLAKDGRTVAKIDTALHVPFGTPEELRAIPAQNKTVLQSWTTVP